MSLRLRFAASFTALLAACASSSESAFDSGSSAPDTGVLDATAPDAAEASDASELDSGVFDAAGFPDATPRDPRPIAPMWTARGSTPPSMDGGLWGAPAVYVPEDGRFLQFGGSLYPANVVSGATWSYALDTATWTELAAADPPAPRFCHALLYLPAHHQVLLVGGRNNTDLLAGAWTLDLASARWTPVAGDVPGGAIGPMLAWMPSFPAGPRAIVFGGSTGAAVTDATWAYDPDARSFSRVMTHAAPPARQDGAMAFDPGPPGGAGSILLFGGNGRPAPSVAPISDQWSFDGVDWRPVNPGALPPARYSTGAAFDRLHREWVIWSGTIETDDLADLWIFDAGSSAWSSASTAGAPMPRGYQAFDYAEDREVFVTFGGLRQPNFRAYEDGWELRLRSP